MVDLVRSIWLSSEDPMGIFSSHSPLFILHILIVSFFKFSSQLNSWWVLPRILPFWGKQCGSLAPFHPVIKAADKFECKGLLCSFLSMRRFWQKGLHGPLPIWPLQMQSYLYPWHSFDQSPTNVYQSFLVILCILKVLLLSLFLASIACLCMSEVLFWFCSFFVGHSRWASSQCPK